MRTSKLVGIALVVLAASLLPGCALAPAQQPGAAPEPGAPQLSAADEKAIRDIMKAQETAWNKHDMNAYMAVYRDDADAINIVGMYWRGKAKILKHLSDFHKTNFKDLEETLDQVDVHAIGDGYAIAILIWKVGAFRGPGGEDIPAARHRSTQVLAKGPDGWKVVHFHNTTINEAAVRNAAGASRE